MISPFTTMVDAFLKAEYEASPVLASGLGLTAYDEKLDDLSAGATLAKEASDAGWLRQFQAMESGTLSHQDAIDRDFAISILRGREVMRAHQMWKRQPANYLNPGSGGIYALFLHGLRPNVELAEAARARLEQLPGNIEAGIANLDFSLAPKVYIQRGIAQARATARYARELVANEVGDPAARKSVAVAGEIAARSVEKFAAFLEGNLGRASGDYAIGDAAYTGLLRQKELLPYSARELRELGREQYDLLVAEANRLAKEIDGSTDWAELCERLNREHAANPEAMRVEYEVATERARAFLKERSLVSFPEGERCVVEPSPHFQRPVLAVASYNKPAAFGTSLVGHFFVPFPPDGTSPEEIQQRLEGNATANVPTTSVHEAYPGHHWHLVMAHANPSKLRKTFTTAYFSEGWALYAERMMREQGFFSDPRHLLYQYEATIFRAARIVVDTSLHLGEMSFEDAVTFMQTKANQPPPQARAEVGRYCSWPTQASSYLTGMLEILGIRTRWLARNGRNDTTALREFHDALTSSGALPTALAERAISG